MKRIPLTQGKFALVDDEDFYYLMQWKWRAKPGRWGDYACRSRRGTTIYMHRELACAITGEIVDHIDNDTLNNQKINLRLANNSQNQMNRTKMRRKTTSRYIGVTKRWNKWCAHITVNRSQMYLGSFANEEDAAIARDVAAQLFHGEFANLNGV